MALTISPPRPYVKFVEDNGNLSTQGYDFCYGMYLRVGGSLSSLNAALLQDKTWDEPGTIGSSTPNTGKFTTLEATSNVTFSGVLATTTLLTINPIAGTMNKVNIGGVTPGTGAFTTLTATTLTVNSPSSTNVTLEPTDRVRITSGSVQGFMDNINIGTTTPRAGAFTSLIASSSFACNAAAPQGSYSVGATLNAYAAGANGLANAADMQALVDKVIALETALKNNGICEI